MFTDCCKDPGATPSHEKVIKTRYILVDHFIDRKILTIFCKIRLRVVAVKEVHVDLRVLCMIHCCPSTSISPRAHYLQQHNGACWLRKLQLSSELMAYTAPRFTMPLDRRAAFQLGLLLLALPVQYLVSRFMSTSDAQRISSAAGFKDKYLSWQSWHQWCLDIIDFYGGQDDINGESPAVEVLKYKDPNGYFGDIMIIYNIEKVEYRV
ncbi:hypothetical protein KUTeg_007328 [Tegillarca granosa]|uniref:Uncharacterized protein n=1 Tax=Tegillarca granosa TaxID=220873 RepID=A0ABQ9FHL0_TEGGR|nr:hypothetical protein KUTeg_007328 [Tegillarca granosa]